MHSNPELIDKVNAYSRKERILRLIEISVKEEKGMSSPTDAIEVELIQALRTANGEIAEVLKERELAEKADGQSSLDRMKSFEDDGAYAD